MMAHKRATKIEKSQNQNLFAPQKIFIKIFNKKLSANSIRNICQLFPSKYLHDNQIGEIQTFI